MAERQNGESQVHNPRSNTWVKRDASGRFVGAQKEPFKGIPREKEEK